VPGRMDTPESSADAVNQFRASEVRVVRSPEPVRPTINRVRRSPYSADENGSSLRRFSLSNPNRRHSLSGTCAQNILLEQVD
jgi:hypothetical protein